MLKKIISGGQTGADRAALDAALESNFPCGGYCPKDRQAEDGRIDTKYPLIEVDGGYADRTEKNVVCSDGTLVFFHEEATGGTQLTVEYCESHKKPCLEIDISGIRPVDASKSIDRFISEFKIQTINVAGPRASECPEVYDFVALSLSLVLERIG